MTPKTIVIGTSLSATSDDLVRAGVAVARAMGGEARLVHGYTLQIFPTEVGGDGTWLAAQEEALRERLVFQAKRTGLADLPGYAASHLEMTADAPHQAIVELARRVKADLIVLGAADAGAVHRFLLGSTADAVLRMAPCPVLVVRSAAAFPPQRVEIAVDLSPISAHALKLGRELLQRIGVPAAATEALFVLSPFEAASSLHFTPPQVERFAREELKRFLETNGLRGIHAQVRTGYPWEEILKVFEERRVDLAILGTHGRRGFDRLLLGSVASGLMHRAACNLLIVPPESGAVKEVAREARGELFGGDWGFVSDEVATPAVQA